jgi:Secretion system C-terminal sorting domain/Receptor L domain
MKKNLLLLATFPFLLSWGTTAQTCLPDGITFSTQEQIDSFPFNYPGCTQILGDVTINASFPWAIFNLDSLSQIKSIGGDMSVYGNDALTSLSGLDNLTSIGGDLGVGSTTMNSLSGLDKLTSIGGSLGVGHNHVMTSLSGLNSLTSIGGVLGVSQNAVLTSLNGLNSLTSIGGWVQMVSNIALTSLNGLENLTSIGGFLQIVGSNSLTNLNGLENLTSIGGDLALSYNDSLMSLSGLDSLTSIARHLEIQNNPMLTSLSGLDKINPATITELIIENNPKLILCDVKTICDYLENGGPATISGNAPGCATRDEIEAACAVPAGEVKSDEVTIYPNPTKGMLEITGLEIGQGAFVVTNTIGSIVKRGAVQSRQIDISGLADGVYFVSLHSENQTLVRRIIKE